MLPKFPGKSPLRPNIPRPPNSRSNSMSSINISRLSNSKLSKYEQYLYPQTFETLSSAAPLAANVIYPIEAPIDEEEEEFEAGSIYEKFERQRKKVLLKYNSQHNSTVIVVALKSDRLKISKPSSSKNESYYQLTKQSQGYSTYEDTTEEDSESDPPLMTAEIQDDPQVLQAYADDLIEYNLNEIWFDSMLLELDEIYPEFLNDMQTKGEQNSGKSSKDNSPMVEKRRASFSTKQSFDDDSYLMFEDPIQAAFSIALKKQRANATYVEEENTRKVEQQSMYKNLSAAELNRQWGFKDPEIGKFIAKFRKQFEDGGKKK